MNEIKQSILKKQPVVLNEEHKNVRSLFDKLLINIKSASKNKNNGIKFLTILLKCNMATSYKSLNLNDKETFN